MSDTQTMTSEIIIAGGGLVGNALTLPLVSLAVMPSAVLGILAYPFALDQPVWWAMGLAVRGMLTISTWIAGFGNAVVVVPAFGTGALGLLAAALSRVGGVGCVGFVDDVTLVAWGHSTKDNCQQLAAAHAHYD